MTAPAMAKLVPLRMSCGLARYAGGKGSLARDAAHDHEVGR